MAEEDRSRSRSRERPAEAPAAAEGNSDRDNSDLRVYVGNLKFEVRYFILFIVQIVLLFFHLFLDRRMTTTLKSFSQNMVTLLRQKLFALETIQVKVKDLVLSHLQLQKVQLTP